MRKRGGTHTLGLMGAHNKVLYLATELIILMFLACFVKRRPVYVYILFRKRTRDNSNTF
jgi:hypothetical protein